MSQIKVINVKNLFLLILTKLFWVGIDCQDVVLPIDKSEWKSINETDSVYYISRASLSWADALRFCGQRNGHLVSFESRKEETHVLALIPVSEKGRFEYWTSGVNVMKEAGFIWIANGRLFKGNYFNFCTSDLLTLWNDAHCVITNDRRNCWQTRNCDASLKFICELGSNVYLD